MPDDIVKVLLPKPWASAVAWKSPPDCRLSHTLGKQSQKQAYTQKAEDESWQACRPMGARPSCLPGQRYMLPGPAFHPVAGQSRVQEKRTEQHRCRQKKGENSCAPQTARRRQHGKARSSVSEFSVFVFELFCVWISIRTRQALQACWLLQTALCLALRSLIRAVCCCVQLKWNRTEEASWLGTE